MYVRDGMRPLDISVGPQHTLHQAARLMAAHDATVALVEDPEGEGPGIFSVLNVFEAVSRGEDPKAAVVADHLDEGVLYASPEWSLEKAADLMSRRNLHFVVVCDRGEIAGIVRMRDIVRCWLSDGATTEVSRAPRSEQDRRQEELESITGF